MHQLVESLMADVAEFTKESEELAVKKSEVATELARRRWLARFGDTGTWSSEMVDFYVNANHYLWELAGWHRFNSWRQVFPDTLVKLCRSYGCHTVLEYGAGICTESLILTSVGVKATAMDFPSTPYSFGKWRAGRYNLSVEFIDFSTTESYQQVVDRKFDLITLLDVIGHVSDPMRVITDIAEHGRILAFIPDFRIGDIYPMHFPKPDGFDKLFSELFRPLAPFIFKSRII